MQKGRSGSDLRTRFRNFSSHASFFLLYQKPQSQSRYRDKRHNNFCCSSSIRKDESIMKHISELLGLKQQIPVENGMKEGFVPTYIHTYTQVSFYGKNLGRIKKEYMKCCRGCKPWSEKKSEEACTTLNCPTKFFASSESQEKVIYE